MLQKIASLVKPIMRKHGWVLPVLAEFFPETPDLVGESAVNAVCQYLDNIIRSLRGVSKGLSK